MADEIIRSRMYGYQANANLVLQAERDAKRNSEPTGEPETLAGRDLARMGDRVPAARHQEIDTRVKRMHEKRARLEQAEKAGKRQRKDKNVFVAGKDASVLTEAADGGANVYRPSTKETRAVYEMLLSYVQRQIGDQPQEFLSSAADETLTILKDQSITDKNRQKEVESLFGTKLSKEEFNKLVNMGKNITDFATGPGEGEEGSDGEGVDEEMGVAVVFDEESEEEDSELDEIGESDDEDEGEEATTGAGLTAAGVDGDEEDITGDNASGLSANDIDAHWLQRQLGKYFEDHTLTVQLSKQIIDVLQSSDTRQVENELVRLLGIERFEFIRTLVQNRPVVMYVTRLRQAQTDEERTQVEAEMLNDTEGGGAEILAELGRTESAEHWSARRTGEFQTRVQAEARRLGQAHSQQKGIDEDDIAITSNGLHSSATGPKPQKVLDLDSLAFGQGGHIMTNTSVDLPDKSWRAQKKGYEEVHVPPLQPRPYGKDESDIPIGDLPEWAQPAFEGMKSLNRVQSRIAPTALESSENMLLCAPTGAGKTNVAVLSMLHTMAEYRRSDGSFDLGKFKIVYVAPMKALVAEIVNNFSHRLGKPYGIVVRELSGDVSLTKAEIAETQVIVTTPEKWDIITRKSGDRTYTQLVRLMIFDEIHLLHDERGAVLESLVARTLRQIESTQEMVRLVGLSATLPNYEDVAAFLRVDPSKGLFFFDNSFRPCPLQQQYIGLTEKKPMKRLALMNQICYDKVLEQAGRNQILIFVHSRKETAKTARFLRDTALDRDELSKFVGEDAATRKILSVEAGNAADHDLKELMPYGFAIHHAGMRRSDRQLVEDLFEDKHIQVLVSTATLAWGVNLPAHTVIIKGTQVYSPERGCWTELSQLDVQQMLGRAGRPQFDTFGEGIILTTHSELQYYLSLMNQQLPIESQLVKRLADYINAEVVLGTIANVRDAAEWIGYSYLYIRMLRNPKQYGIDPSSLDDDPLLLQHRLDLAHSAAVLLDRHYLIRYDRRSGAFQTTALGRVAAHYYIVHPTVAAFNDHLKPTLSDIELFRVFALSHEFRNIVVRQEEKEELRKLIERVPIPVKESMEEPTAKVNVLLQAYISRLRMDGLALVADMAYVQQSGVRLLRAIFEVALRRGWAALADKALTLCKMVDKRMWLSQTPLRQITKGVGAAGDRGLPDELLRKLEKKDIAWERYFDLTPADLGELVRIPKLGKTIHRLVHSFPKVELQAHVQPITRATVRIELTIAPDFKWDNRIHGSSEIFWVLVEDTDGEHILHSEQFILKAQFAEEDHLVSFTVPLTEPMPPQYFVRVVSDRWLHCSSVLPVSFQHLILPQKFAPPTELLDLQPLPVSELKTPAFEVLYTTGTGMASPITHFNPIQTQTFNTLYGTDENAMVAAPTGSGKTICAEFALLRLFAADPDASAVYIAPLPGIAQERFADWETKFGEGLGKNVVELTGEAAADVKLLQRAHITIATPEQWDRLSRRWKQRKAVQNVSLLIVDELHLIGAAVGPTLEIITSRMRFIAAQKAEKGMGCRIIALSASVANARDLGEWVGASSRNIFNFHPQVRPVPLELRLHGFDIHNAGSRLLAMSRPTYNAITNSAAVSQKPSIVFVPSRKQTQLTAIDIMTAAAAEGKPFKFAFGAVQTGKHAGQEEDSELNEIANNISEPALAHCLRRGIAFFHEGMRSDEREIVEQLWMDNKLGVLVATASMAWGMRMSAHLVVIMDTQSYDGREHRYVDYPIADILQMIGRASRPSIDETGRCVLLCHTSKREHLKKFVSDPLPVESHLDHFLHDHMNAEIVTRTIENKGDAVDWLTWTFFYRRLTQNPNYYNLQGDTNRHISDHLSELVESTMGDLEASRCIAVDDMDVAALNLGMISAYYYVHYTTIEIFASSVSAKTKLKGLLEILAHSTEFAELPVRHGEDKIIRSMAMHLPVALTHIPSYSDPHVKANILLQSHFSRRPLPADLRADQAIVLKKALPLLQAMVDVIASSGWLRPALAAMELSQMILQGIWASKDSVLLQIPHFTAELASKCEKYVSRSNREENENEGVETVYDLMELEDDERDSLLQLPATSMADVARFCNRYPNIALEFDVPEKENIGAGEATTVIVKLEREAETEGLEEGAGLGAVHASLFPGAKSEGWWLAVGEPASNKLHAIKRVVLGKTLTTKLMFEAPESLGAHELQLYFMSDSYLGCDQEYEFDLQVVEGESDEEDEEEDDTNMT